MRRMFTISLLAWSCVLLCSCNNAQVVGSQSDRDDAVITENPTVNEEVTLRSKVDRDTLTKYELVDPEHILEKVKDVKCPAAEQPDIPLKVITTDGELYYLCLNKLYSNDTNFKKVDVPVKFERFLGDYAVGEDNKLYQLYFEPITEISSSDYQQLEKWYGTGITDYTKITSMSYEVQIKLEDNQLYDCKTTELLFTFPKGVVVEYVIDDTVKTNDGWYAFTYVCENQEEVDKYADVEPVYKFVCKKVLGTDVYFYKDLSTGGKNGLIIKDGVLSGMTGY